MLAFRRACSTLVTVELILVSEGVRDTNKFLEAFFIAAGKAPLLTLSR